MKNILLILFAVVVLSGCSKDDEIIDVVTNIVLVKQIDFVDGANTSNRIYTYNGNKLSQITQGKKKVIITYNGDLIVKGQSFKEDGSSSFKQEYFYENDKLKSYYLTDGIGTSTYINKETYIYNTDGTVGYNSYVVDAETKVETLTKSGVYTIYNGNVVRVENSRETIVYDFDTYNSPIKNVVGVNKIFDLSFNKNNIIKQTVINKVSSVVNTSSYEYDYNQDGYPTEQRYFYNGKASGTMKYSY